MFLLDINGMRCRSGLCFQIFMSAKRLLRYMRASYLGVSMSGIIMSRALTKNACHKESLLRMLACQSNSKGDKVPMTRLDLSKGCQGTNIKDLPFTDLQHRNSSWHMYGDMLCDSYEYDQYPYKTWNLDSDFWHNRRFAVMSWGLWERKQRRVKQASSSWVSFLALKHWPLVWTFSSRFLEGLNDYN